ncbi:hypothetical protein CTI12_AA197680 [Artemisia annua]|uniref:Uncharacterized protein n=1 Tax=Artemisia annua TaxID=35608 RepID=A0A2U1P3K7_ARTAN|nr:hypothetical protein CTI12_AA197680 [Artemisia annua]
MVNTRSIQAANGTSSNGQTTTTAVDLNTTLANLQRSMDQMNESIRGLLIFQQHATGELNRLTSGEGTSNRMGGSGQQNGGSGQQNGGSGYGRLTKL